MIVVIRKLSPTFGKFQFAATCYRHFQSFRDSSYSTVLIPLCSFGFRKAHSLSTQNYKTAAHCVQSMAPTLQTNELCQTQIIRSNTSQIQQNHSIRRCHYRRRFVKWFSLIPLSLILPKNVAAQPRFYINRFYVLINSMGRLLYLDWKTNNDGFCPVAMNDASSNVLSMAFRKVCPRQIME